VNLAGDGLGLESVGTPLLWIGFVGLVAAMLALDLGVFQRHAHVVRIREALAWSFAWIALAFLFNAGIYLALGPERALEFLTGYVIEKALSVDNLFVFLLIFSSFGLPPAQHHRILFWGILGAMLLRGAFILAGVTLLQTFHWVIYLFGAFLIFTGAKLLVRRTPETRPDRNPLFLFFQRLVPAVSTYRGSRFTVVENGRRCATPLLLVLVAVEVSDIAFAVDSIPAVFGVTRDPFIVYTSNIFAILGLRALYFVLAGVLGTFRYLNTGLALVLAFVGGKMMLAGIYEVPIGTSLAVIAALLGGSVLVSLLRPAPPPASDARPVIIPARTGSLEGAESEEPITSARVRQTRL